MNVWASSGFCKSLKQTWVQATWSQFQTRVAHTEDLCDLLT